MNSKDFLKAGPVCRMLNVSKQTLYDWHFKGKLVPKYIDPVNKYRFYSPEQIKKFKLEYKRNSRGWYKR